VSDHIDFTDHATELAALRHLRTQIAELKETEAALEQRIKDRLGAHTEARVNGRPVLTWRWTKPRQQVDTRALRREHPDLVADYTRTTEASRRFVLLEDAGEGGGQ